MLHVCMTKAVTVMDIDVPSPGAIPSPSESYSVSVMPVMPVAVGVGVGSMPVMPVSVMPCPWPCHGVALDLDSCINNARCIIFEMIVKQKNSFM